MRSDSSPTSRRFGVAAVAAGMLLAGLAACSDDETSPEASLNLECEKNGLCECVNNSWCPEGKICINGECRILVPPGEDATVPEPDLGGGSEVASDVPIKPGHFKAPCGADAECNSGICLEVSNDLSLCTEECIDDCPGGWECRGISQDDESLLFICMPKSNRLCQPCKMDVSCGGKGNLCLNLGGSPFCGRGCTEVPCPPGYLCSKAVSIEGIEAMQCVPEKGQCQCTPDNVGKHFQCDVSNDYGTCIGDQVCQEDGAMSTCIGATPEPETCDSKDNDCNGFIDDGIPPYGCEVSNEYGTCLGQVVCIPGVGETCKAPVAGPELCDHLDNNCDSTTDEGFTDDNGAYGLIDHCGGCGLTCQGMFANALEVGCEASTDPPHCMVKACNAGFLLVDNVLCLPAVHHLCEPCSSDEACVGPMDKCFTMSPTDTQTFCGRDCSPGNQYGTECPEGYLCSTVLLEEEEWQQCVPANGTCDCNELAAGQQKPCTVTNAEGSCYGISKCDPLLGWTGCTAKTPLPETCDGLDNDCDGLIDEGVAGDPCFVDNEFGSCPGAFVCLGEQGLSCVAPQPAPESCDGKDNDCNGATDEPFATALLDDQGNPVGLVYDKTDEHCGGCGLPCVPVPPASKTACAADGLDAICQVLECLPGYYPSDVNSCFPVPAAGLCLPCQDDGDCLGPDDQCLDYQDGKFCGRDCSPTSIYSLGTDAVPCTGEEGSQGCCPQAFLCLNGQCTRESMACDCDADGKMRDCSLENAFGTCFGVELCKVSGQGAGWQPCNAQAAAPELCDGKDNDCDGLFDALDDSVDTAGLPGYPLCSNVSEACSGKWICGPKQGLFQWSCTAPTPEPETCNGLDDDCDGDADEDFKDDNGAFSLLSNCGQCGMDCNVALANLASGPDGKPLPGAVQCQTVKGKTACVPQQCAPGYYLFPPAGTPSVCLKLKAANCQPCGLDEDCPGQGHSCVTVGDDDGAWCAQRCDAGSPYPGCQDIAGQQGCCPTGYLCLQAPGQAPGELHCLPASNSCQCNAGNDGLERPCTLEGNGGQTTCFGTSQCGKGGNGLYLWGPCNTTSTVEVCDALDNDCDGTVDEGFLAGGKYASDEHCGTCGKNCTLKWSQQEQHAAGVCDADLPGGPDCVLGPCLDENIGGGTWCRSDADCVGNAAGEYCLPGFFQCGQACAGNADCKNADCVAGWCAPQCAANAECQAKFGTLSQCVQQHCVTPYDWVDLDDWTGNGCECPAAIAFDEPDLLPNYPLPGAVVVDRNCDGIDGDAATALFVWADSPAGDGSLAAPFPTIKQAIDAFNPAVHTQILVATGSYAEQVVLKNGIKLYGGYSSDFAQRDVALFPTVIEAPVPNFAGPFNPAALYASGITQQTVVAGFVIRGYDVPAQASAFGQPTYAVYVASSSSALRIVNNWIVGGNGGPGQPAAPGAAGQTGGNGSDGPHSAECLAANCTGACNNKSCQGHVQKGGSGGANASCSTGTPGCPGMEAEGAESPQVADAPPAGCSYASGGQSATYGGGPANLCKYDCYVNPNMNGPSGAAGKNGASGQPGNACLDQFGVFANGAWKGTGALAGTGGTHGAGGQGGSAGAYVTNNKGAGCSVGNLVGDLGGGGGGGGSGGCGGAGGAAGVPGGASFVAAIVSGSGGTFADLSANVIVRGLGGTGGNGGNGATGGKGGAGGVGGTSGWPAWCAGIGGAGGHGGDGGPGGGGGGGCGGPSIGIALVGTSGLPYSGKNKFSLLEAQVLGGDGGPGGLSPDPAKNGAKGASGANQNVKEY